MKLRNVVVIPFLVGVIACANAFVPPASQPGVSSPLGFFDPLGFSKNRSPLEFKKIQESEVKHSRIAMLAALGLILQDTFHPLFKDQVLGAPIYHYQIASTKYPWLTPAILASIGLIEAVNIKKGWDFLSPSQGIATLREDYVPGDLGFDPLGLATTPENFSLMRTRELNNGRLAMIACLLLVLQQYTGSPSPSV